MSEQFRIFLLLYVRPLEAMGHILDRGSVWFAVVLALAVAVLVWGPVVADGGHPDRPAVPPKAHVAPIVPAESAPAARPSDQPALRAVPFDEVGGPWWLSRMPTVMARLPLLGLALMAMVFVPVAIMVVAAWDGLGSASVVVRRDYMPVVACHLFAFSAALLPALPLRLAVQGLGLTTSLWWLPWAAAVAGFLLLSVITVRKVPGTGYPHALGAVAAGGAASVVGLALFAVAGSLFYYLASPWFLYYAYIMVGSEVQSFSGGLASRQRMKTLLETATLNPRDADAHYQLGLLYQQRRDSEQAVKAFEQSLAIDRNEVDPHYQLGRIQREQGRLADALYHFEQAARLDDKHSSSEVWREMGATLAGLDRHQEAQNCLEKYVERHPFDAEGQYRLGLSLEALDRKSEAQQAYRLAVEAVETAPPHRRKQIQSWGTLAAKRLR
jgi:Flp pilus assembly protein TadD